MTPSRDPLDALSEVLEVVAGSEWRFYELSLSESDQWEAQVSRRLDESHWTFVEGAGPTPIIALRVLAAAARARLEAERACDDTEPRQEDELMGKCSPPESSKGGTAMSEQLSDTEVETIYAAYETVLGWEAKSVEGKRGIVEPLYRAVIEARVATAQSGSGDMAVALDDYYRARHTKDPAQVRRANSAIKSATLETIRRYHAGEITERQACDWFGVDRLTLRTVLLAAEPEGDGLDARPEIVCLCGSTRFYDDFQQANYKLTMAGRIVLSVGFYPHAKTEHGHGEGVGHDSAEKVALDELHKRKIDLADWVYILNRNGYIGESTRSEIDYALAHGKPVRYAFDTDGVGSLLGWERPDHAATNAALRASGSQEDRQEGTRG